MTKFPLALVCFALCALFGCNRDGLNGPAGSRSSAKDQINRYLSNLIKSSSSQTSQGIEKLCAHLDLGKITTGQYLGRTMYVVETEPAAAVKERNKISEAVFYTYHDSIVSAGIIQFGSDECSFTVLKDKFVETVYGAVPFSGTIYYNHLSGMPLAVLSYEGGKMIKEKRTVSRPAGSPANRTAASGSNMLCTGWYLEEYDPYTGDLISSELLWIDCDNDTKDAEGGGGNGGTSGEAEAENILAQLMNSQPVSEPVSVSTAFIDPIRKERNPDWRCHKGLTWGIISYEKGIVKYDSEEGNGWTWESLTHGSMSLVGMTPGGTVTPQIQSATPSFVPGTPNVKYASISLKYTLTYTVVPPVGSVFPVTVPYSSNSPFWSAGT